MYDQIQNEHFCVTEITETSYALIMKFNLTDIDTEKQVENVTNTAVRTYSKTKQIILQQMIVC